MTRDRALSLPIQISLPDSDMNRMPLLLPLSPRRFPDVAKSHLTWVSSSHGEYYPHLINFRCWLVNGLFIVSYSTRIMLFEKENSRINLRKQHLAKQTQRINEARARAAASKANSPTPVQTTTEQVPPPAAPQPPVRPPQVPSATSPIHPSLPAKPLSASEARPSTPTVKTALPSQSTAPAPQPASSTVQPQSVPSSSPAVPAPLPESTDPMIAKAEEVRPFSLTPHILIPVLRYSSITFSSLRTNTEYLG